MAPPHQNLDALTNKRSSCILILLACFVTLSCQNQKTQERFRAWMGQNGKIKVLCTTVQVAALVTAVGGQHVDALVLISGQNDPHSYQIVKGDDEKFRRADIIFYSGLQLEHGSTLVRYLRSPKAVACCGTTNKKNTIIWLSSIPDPHMWMDASIWADCASSIAEKLSALQPEFQADFEQNALETKRQYVMLHRKLQHMFSTIPSEKRYLVTTHDAFNYFCRAYLSEENERSSEAWRQRCIAPEGLSSESQISTQDISLVVQYVKRHRIPVIFTESGMNKDSVQKVVAVCHAKGLTVKLAKAPLYSDTMGDDDTTTYQEMMEHNASVIINALKEEP